MRRCCHAALVYFLTTVLAVGGGCQSSTRTARYRIVVIPKGTTHNFWKSIHAGARKVAAELASMHSVNDAVHEMISCCE